MKGVNRLLEVEKLEQIIEEHTDSLIRLAYYYVRDVYIAEDIVQEVFIKFYHAHHLYEERGQLKAYLSRLVMNRSKDYLKSWSYRKVQIQQKISLAAKKKKSGLIQRDEQELVGEAILKLPIKQREVLMYYYFEELSIAEIATILEIPEGTVKTRMRRGKELLKPELTTIEWEVLLNE